MKNIFDDFCDKTLSVCRAVEEICFNTAKMLEVAQLELWICWRASDVFFKTNSSLHVGVMESSDDFGVCL